MSSEVLTIGFDYADIAQLVSRKSEARDPRFGVAESRGNGERGMAYGIEDGHGSWVVDCGFIVRRCWTAAVEESFPKLFATITLSLTLAAGRYCRRRWWTRDKTDDHP